MRTYSILKGIRWVNASAKSIVVAAIVAMIMGVFVGCEEEYTHIPKEPVKVSAPTPAEIAALSEQIKHLVKALEYSDKVAQDFAQIAIGWKDKQGRLVLVVWKQRLNQARQEYKQGKISKAQLAKVEESVAKQLSQRIRKEISYKEKFFDLANVIKHKQAQCLGYSQLVYIVGNSTGLSVKAINVGELISGSLPLESRHIACLVSLSNDKIVMVDLAFKTVSKSKPFKLEEEFTKAGNCWEIKDKSNPLNIHRRIQILDKNGLIACLYHNRGTVYAELGQHTKAISSFNKAIELNPKNAAPYSNRGTAYVELGQLSKALSDYTKAIELNPKFAEAYSNRGNVYRDLGQHTKAISDFNKAIELNPKFAPPYNNRGIVYYNLYQSTQAISDFTRAIELNPKYGEAYYNRGNTYYRLGQRPKAIFDYTTAIKVNPNHAKAYGNRGYTYARLGKSEEAKQDFLKAVELDPSLKSQVKKISDDLKLNLKLD